MPTSTNRFKRGVESAMENTQDIISQEHKETESVEPTEESMDKKPYDNLIQRLSENGSTKNGVNRTIYFPDDVDRRLNNFVKKSGKKRSQIVAEILREVLPD